MGLPQEGELFLELKDARSTKAKFTLPADGPLTVDKQGTRRVSLLVEWPQVALYVIKYITYKGRYSNLHSPHFKLLSHLRHGWRVNVPNFLYHLISISAKETWKNGNRSVNHHCLIKLLVEHSIRDVSQMEWGVFEDILQFRVEDALAADDPPVEEENIAEPSSLVVSAENDFARCRRSCGYYGRRDG